MLKKFKILAIIPARGGSKGIPHKNIRLLAGKPLIAHSIAAAKKSRLINRILVSTDDKRIAAVARQRGAEVPFLRPKALAGDKTPDYPVLRHAIDFLRKHEGYAPDLVVHLRPTGPFRTAAQIDEAIRLLVAHPSFDSVRSVHAAAASPYKMWVKKGPGMRPLLTLKNKKEAYNSPRQSLPVVYQTNPNVGVCWTKTILKKKSIIGAKVLPLLISGPVADIDSEIDFKIAELLLKKRRG